MPVPGEGFVLGRLGRQMERYRTRVAWGKLLSQCSQVGVFFFPRCSCFWFLFLFFDRTVAFDSWVLEECYDG